MRLSDIIIRSIQPNDLSGAFRLSTNQGWNQTESDWKMMIDNKQNICLLAEYQSKIIGTTTAINYSDEVAWISMVLVDVEFRGNGISKKLLEEIFKKITHCKSIKLDATPEGQRVYKNYNFIDEYSISRMTCNSIQNISPAFDDVEFSPVDDSNLKSILDYDHDVFGANRDQFIQYMVKSYKKFAWIGKRNGKFIGFVLGRDGRKFHHIGPVFAKTIDDAKMLISKAIAVSRSQSLVVDILDDKTDLLNWLHGIGFEKQRTFMRMYKTHNPFPGIISQQYLIGGPEFG